MKRFNASTLKDISKRCGVSLGTTSAVFNNKTWVSENVRKRVLKAAKELNYQPNQAARSLKTKKSNTIGLIVSDITNPFFPEIIRSIESRTRDHDYSIILCDANENNGIGLRSFHLLVSKQVDGIILVGGNMPAEDLRAFLLKRDYPIVVIERDYRHPSLNTIIVDSEAGALMATTHLLDLGFWPVGFISGPLKENQDDGYSHGSIGRLEGYKLSLRKKGIPFDPTLVKEGNFHFNGGYDAMVQFLKQKKRPRAIFASNDLMAIGAMEAAKANGACIPDDIAFAGYDDIPGAAYCSPPLTSVALPKKKLGTLAAEIILKSISSQANEYQKFIFPQDRLLISKSSGAR